MPRTIVMMEQFISTEDIDVNQLQCPQCTSTTIILHGNSQIPRTEIWEGGKVITAITDPKLHCFEIEVIECLNCMTRSKVKSKEVMQLQEQNFKLRQQVIDLGGKDPFGFGRIH